MARPLRIQVPDGLSHVATRALERRPIVVADAHRGYLIVLDTVGRLLAERTEGVSGAAVSNAIAGVADRLCSDQRVPTRVRPPGAAREPKLKAET